MNITRQNPRNPSGFRNCYFFFFALIFADADAECITKEMKKKKIYEDMLRVTVLAGMVTVQGGSGLPGR